MNRNGDPKLDHAKANQAKSGTLLSQFGASQIGLIPYLFLVIAVLAQGATILITWSVWQVRTEIPNLPWISSTPQVPCEFLLLFSLAAVLISPRRFGMALHIGVLGFAIAMDQFRCQPQVISISVLMAACVWPAARRLGYWYLVAMWLWSGIHKLVSPDWLGSVSYYLLSHRRLGISEYYYGFALGVAVTEIGMAVIALLRPRIAAFLCIGGHVGIVIFLVTIQWNYSVVPWNLCNAIVGGWILWTVASDSCRVRPRTKAELVMAIALLVIPVGFYFGWVRHCFAHVLYSGNLPQAVITRSSGLTEPVKSIEFLKVPFPHVHKAYRDYLGLTGKRGEKLHVRDPRPAMADRYYVMSDQRVPEEISRNDFIGSELDSVAGTELDDRRAVFQLRLGHATMKKRTRDGMIYAIRFDPEFFHPELLESLIGLPNLEQIQLEDCDVDDADLVHLAGLTKLEMIGLDRTRVTDVGLEVLGQIRSLSVIHCEGTNITDDAMNAFLNRVFRREAFGRE